MPSQLLAQIGNDVLEGRNMYSGPEVIGKLFNQLFTLIIIAGAFLVLYNLIMGGLGWISAGGEKDKIEKARKQITNSIIGLVILMSIWTVYFLITADILGIFTRDASGNPIFKFPTLFE
jgi:cytochrome bd-type quinol oxidase subunit 2